MAPAEAEALYRQGVIAWNDRTAAGFEQAIADFQAAIAIDSEYAAAHAGLANVYNLISQYTAMPPAAAYAKAATAADRALALDPGSAEAYTAKAFNLFYGAHEFVRSAEMFEAALDRDPEAAQTRHWYALTSMHMGAFEKPLEPSTGPPRSPRTSHHPRQPCADPLMPAGRRGGRAAQGAEAPSLTISPRRPISRRSISRSAGTSISSPSTRRRLGREQRRAIEDAAAARRGWPTAARPDAWPTCSRAAARICAGKEPAFKLAVTAAMRGDTAVALDYLTTAVERGESDALSIRIESAFRRLYGDPRFSALVETVGF